MQTLRAVLVSLALGALDTATAATVRVVTSITDLGSIAASVGGEHVEVVSIARPTNDPHRVEVLPSYMVRVSRAHLYFKVGLGLDLWADRIIDGSHNGDVHIIDCSKGVEILEKPSGQVDASMGDVHPNGNPHYWLDPRNATIVARTIAAALADIDPEHAAVFEAGAAAFAKEADDVLARGMRTLAALPARDIITYHRSWSYFAHAFDLEVASTIEPIPGIPPTAHHLQDLVAIVRERRIPVAITEPYFSKEAPEFLQRETGIRIVRESPSCDDVKAGSWAAHIDRVCAALAGGATGSGH